MRDSLDLELTPLPEAAFPRTWAALRAGLAEEVAPGYVAGVWSARDAGRIRVAALGKRRIAPSEQPMEPETVFDLASVSKVMATATLAALLVERRWLRWDLPVRAVFPGFASREIEVRHLLSHTAGFVAWQPLWEKLRARFGPRPLHEAPVEERQRAMRELVFAIAPDARPGERTTYSDISFLVLGFLLEEITGMALDGAVRKLVWDPAGVRGAFYARTTRSAAEGRMEEAAATEDCPWRGAVLQGQVHDDNCWAMGGYAGHAGAFGSVRDVLQFSRRLFEGWLSRETLSACWARVGEPPGCERTLGWDTPSGEEPSASRLFSPRSVGHLGFTGTSLWIDPDAGLAVALLGNRVHPSRENELFKPFRPRFHRALREDLGY